MALGRHKGRQPELLLTWAEMPRSPGHAFYDRLQAELLSAGFDGFVEGQCAPYYAARQGRPSLPPGRYFRMLLVGYFEGIDSERGLEWRCADSLSLREFLRLGERTPCTILQNSPSSLDSGFSGSDFGRSVARVFTARRW